MPDRESPIGRMLVEAAYAAHAAQDLDALARLLHPEVAFRPVATPALLPHAGQVRGRSEVIDRLVRLHAAIAVTRLEVLEILVRGRRAASRCRIAYVVQATGAAFESEFAHFWEIRDGLLAGIVEFFDTGLAAAAFEGRPGAPVPGAASGRMDSPTPAC